MADDGSLKRQLRPLYLRRKYAMMREHHVRLQQRPDPVAAQREFDTGIKRGRRVELLQVAFLVLFYFSFVGAITSHFLIGPLEEIRSALNLATNVSAAMSTVFLLGGVVCTRYLMLLDVELFFYSQEARGSSRGVDAAMGPLGAGQSTFDGSPESRKPL